ncbi:PREDICTED: single-pass membrane and coiled-coil domain-containing protein 4 isoform X1 [Sturnus vulgaris]|uniref:single-pass membrane and coiled-coil domain-containing protein 4 isoform X1 n=1 Tax=Sturnus vulgaris TaxID=9172 RepID=UPI00071A28F5|nr:PREDICTED: single-pass membrane and coiled-coil domain-containing protein 4 isoform X1 [Sturnus vulgaris]
MITECCSKAVSAIQGKISFQILYAACISPSETERSPLRNPISCLLSSFLCSQPLNRILQPLVSKDLGQSSAVPLPLVPHFSKKKDPKGRMRQLRGKPKKETSKDKKERKQAMQEARQQITTVVLPTLAVVVLLIVVFVYVATRPNTTE